MSGAPGHLAATTVVANATVVTVDADDTVITGGAVAFDATGTITAVGPTEEVTAAAPGATVVEARGGILLPALVNAHTHLAMTMFRGYADDCDLQGFLDKLLPTETRVLSEASVRAGARLAYAESMLAGTTTALDMFWWPEAAAEEAVAAGFRLVTGPTFIGFPGPDQRVFADRMRWAERYLQTVEGPRWLQPHSTYTLTPDELAEVRALAEATGARVHVHASENPNEVADVRARYGRTPVELLDDVGLLGPGTVLAHAVVLADHEVALLAERGTAVAHCPLSNLKLASGICRVPDLLAAGVTVGLGTDGCASSNDLDLFLALRVAATLHKGVRGDATTLPARQALRMATIGSARALGLEDAIGSIEPGKQADLVLLDPDSPSLTPSYDPVATVVYAASRADVGHVWSAGRHVVEDRRLTSVDLPAALADVRRLQARIDA